MGKLLKKASEFCNEWNEPAEYIGDRYSVSIIIPAYYPEHLDAVVEHLDKIGGFDEIIIVDDTGKFCEDDYTFARKYNNVRVYYHEKNMGRPITRNTGAAFAKGEILVFMDQDMFLSPDFFVQLNKYYSTNSSLLFLGLRHTLPFTDIPKDSQLFYKDREKDWRVKTYVNPEFVDLTVLNVGGANNFCTENQELRLVEETDSLKKMGIVTDMTRGFWDLPSMVVSHSMAITNEDFFSIGGFPEWIQGWGGEDIVIGFLACAAHIPIILSDCLSYQVQHNPYSGSEEAKIKELQKNIKYYRQWAKEANEFSNIDKLLMRSRARGWKES